MDKNWSEFFVFIGIQMYKLYFPIDLLNFPFFINMG